MEHSDVDPTTNLVSGSVVDAATCVHTELGPGLYERPYKLSLAHELRQRGHHVDVEVELPIEYRGLRIERAYWMDLVVDERVVVEVKAVEKLDRVHARQLFTYLKLSGHQVGLLINFDVPHLRQGVQRIIRTSAPSAPPRGA